MSHEYYNIVIGGEGVRRRSNGINAEKIIFFSTFVRVSKGLLSTIVCQYSIAYISVIISQMELKFANNSYFKQLFQNLRPKLQYSKNRIFVTSHFGTL